MTEREKILCQQRRALDRLAAANRILGDCPREIYYTHYSGRKPHEVPDATTSQRDIWTTKMYDNGVEIISFKNGATSSTKVSLHERRRTLAGIVYETRKILNEEH